MAAGNGGAASSNGELTLRGWALEAEAAANIAKALAPTDFVPEQLRRYENPEERDPRKRVLNYDQTVQTVAAVLLAGQELGFRPMASLRAFTIIRGTVAMYALAARALLLNHGHDVIVVETTSTRAIVRARRFGTDQWQQSTWDLDRARTARLFPGHPDGNWSRQPKAMLVARATAEASRWVAADAMLGLPLFVEEVEDGHLVPPGMIAGAVEEGQAPAAPAPVAPAAAKRARQKAPARAALPSGPPPPEPPAPVAEPVDDQPKPTQQQMKKLHAGLRDLQITDKEQGLALLSAWISRPLASTSNLNRPEMVLVLGRMDALLSIAAKPEGGDEDRDEDQPDPPPPDAALEDNPP